VPNIHFQVMSFAESTMPCYHYDPFCKWGINFIVCHPTSNGVHKYNIVAIGYFTKWETTCLFFNHIVTYFSVSKQLFFDHGTHFKNKFFQQLDFHLGFMHKFTTLYYPQANG